MKEKHTTDKFAKVRRILEKAKDGSASICLCLKQYVKVVDLADRDSCGVCSVTWTGRRILSGRQETCARTDETGNY